MKKVLPILVVLAVGVIALAAVYHFRASRLTAGRIQEIQEAESRLATAEGGQEAEKDSSEATPVASTEASEATSNATGSTAGASNEQPKAPNRPANIVAIAPESMPAKAPDTFTVAFECTNGIFAVECFKDWAPNGVERFYELVKNGYFTDMRVFRVVPGFVAQFGISGDPQKSMKWLQSNIPDDPVKQPNVKGTFTFAAGQRPNTRSAQVFVNLDDNSAQLDGRGFAPIGKVVYGMDTVEGFYSGYGEQITQLQGQIAQIGNSFLDQNFPKLDSIKRAMFVEKIEEVKQPEMKSLAELSKTVHHPADTAPDVFKVNMETTKGTFVVECHRDWAPLGADRFYTLVKQGYYDGSPFFRVITEPQPFVAQFGIHHDPSINKEWRADTLAAEPVKESNTLGRLSFAMQSGRPDTRTAQVFINLADNSRLDGLGFAPFGEVVEGMGVVNQLYSGYQDKADQAKMMKLGSTFWEGAYPGMDIIKKATIVQ